MLELNNIECFKEFQTNLFETIETHNLILVEGDYCTGKTTYIRSLIESRYRLIYYNCINTKGSKIIKELSKSVAKYDILSMFMDKSQRCKNILIIDDVNVLNEYDKGGLSSINKFIKGKNTISTPIIFITSPILEDKRLLELSSLCSHLKFPSLNDNVVMETLLKNMTPELKKTINFDIALSKISGNLSLLNKWILNNCDNTTVYKEEKYKQSTRELCNYLLNTQPSLEHHDDVIHSKERVTLSMVLHENMRGSLEQHINHIKLLCDADTIDYIIFKIQNWNFQVYSSLLKNMNVLYIYRNSPPPSKIIFTKILTKYATQYNNMLYIHNILQKYSILKNELLDENTLNKRIDNVKERKRIIKILH